ncbi:hypothetical protein CBR_g6708 [Chara braunii]|uniref:SUI1 domain-containing protein n=1 Tax=Chara braunii TaxID=69332 RepID=A0A388KKJ7_CHABU|nr:hypothetical protein CBR_g6708 [Chara braunii]|eukprot:GBG70581.1 hypothetical protein CBR_g6708 [Chara braunii]
MFKKPSGVKGQQRLSGADSKKLRKAIRDKFHTLSDEDLDVLFPPKVEVYVVRLTNRASLYSVDSGPPIFFDADGRGALYPTVYGLWKVPHIVPSFTLKGGEVSRYVLGGADLMFPGIDVPDGGLPGFGVGEIWAIKVPFNDSPIAVGITVMSSADGMKAKLRGKLLHVAHYYRDWLWDSADGKYVPNEGFKEDIVVEDPNVLAKMEAAFASVASGEADTSAKVEHGGESEKAEDAVERGMTSHLAWELGSTAAAAADNVEGAPTNHEADGRASEMLVNAETASESGPRASRAAVMTDLHGLVLSDKGSGVGNDEADTHFAAVGESVSSGTPVSGPAAASMTVDEVDALLEKSFLQALHTSVKDRDLPIAAGNLWSAHILLCRPPGTHLDVKKSSYKKMSKFLQAKAAEGLVSAKEDKHRKEMMLVSINRGHPTYMEFVPEKRMAGSVQQQEKQSVAVSGGGGGGGASGKENTPQIEVCEVWKPVAAVLPIFVAVGADPAGLYRYDEVLGIGFKYIEKEGLTKANDKAIVTLDATLCDALFKGAIKKGTSYPSEIAKKDVGPAFIRRMQAHHRVTRDGVSVVRKGALRPVQIFTEKRQGNKKMTRMSGVESFLVDAEALAAELQKRFACSTSAAELAGKKGQFEVLVQGGVLEELAHHMITHYGIPKKHIEVMDKTKGGGRH